MPIPCRIYAVERPFEDSKVMLIERNQRFSYVNPPSFRESLQPADKAR